jgi:hypothetical protein
MYAGCIWEGVVDVYDETICLICLNQGAGIHAIDDEHWTRDTIWRALSLRDGEIEYACLRWLTGDVGEDEVGRWLRLERSRNLGGCGGGMVVLVLETETKTKTESEREDDGSNEGDEEDVTRTMTGLRVRGCCHCEKLIRLLEDDDDIMMR